MQHPIKIAISDNKALLQRVAGGDEMAFRELMIQHSGLIYSFLYKHVQREEIVKELVNDVFLHIWLTRETLMDINNFNTYLFVICRNHALNAVKKELRERKRNENWYLQIASEPVDKSGDEEELLIIESAIEQLPPQQKKVWIASRRDGKTYEQIASQLGISRETVKTHLQAANLSIKKNVLTRIQQLSIILLSQEIFK